MCMSIATAMSLKHVSLSKKTAREWGGGGFLFYFKKISEEVQYSPAGVGSRSIVRETLREEIELALAHFQFLLHA